MSNGTLLPLPLFFSTKEIYRLARRAACSRKQSRYCGKKNERKEKLVRVKSVSIRKSNANCVPNVIGSALALNVGSRLQVYGESERANEEAKRNNQRLETNGSEDREAR